MVQPVLRRLRRAPRVAALLAALWLPALAPADATAPQPELQPGLRLWLPLTYLSKHGRPETHSGDKGLEELLGERLGKAVTTHLYRNLDELLQRAAQGQVDHAIVNDEHGEPLIRQFNYEVLARTPIELALYTHRKRQTDSSAPLTQLGLLQLSPESLAHIERELAPRIGKHRPSYHHYTSEASAFIALFDGDIDGLISRSGVITRLHPQMQQQLVAAQRFQHQTSIYFLVAPSLSTTAKQRLRDFYFSSAAADYFRRAGGLDSPLPP